MITAIRKAINTYLAQQHIGKMNLKAVLFDMDGVLYNSMRYHTKAWKETMDSIGISSTREEFYLYEGRTGRSTINYLFEREKGRSATDIEKADIYAIKSALFNKYNKGETIKDTDKVLAKVTSYNLQPVLVTGSGQDTLINKLNTDYPGCFKKDMMVTAHDVQHGKPHPEPYLMGLKKANCQINEAIVIENAPLGVESAHKAGLFTIAVNTGPLPDNILLYAGADLLFPDMASLAEAWDEIMHAFNNR